MSGGGEPAKDVRSTGGPAKPAPQRLELEGIEKQYGSVPILRGASLSAAAGEIVGLCGEKGTGKSTLVQIMAGVLPHRSYRGDVLLDGVVQRFARPSDAREAGIAVVHQKLML